MELCLILTKEELFVLYDIFRDIRWDVSASVEYSIVEWMGHIRDMFHDREAEKRVKTYKLLFKGQYYDMFTHCIEEARKTKLFFAGASLTEEIYNKMGGIKWK